ncbi:winged helix-turn-helix domain-containing protein [Archangium violaceum]|uniref:winged helix-turn-helix domain-containing protein n=1 Tax=Archangium violaceum TaxID=83451 RepID=UPI00193BCC5E|nr:winged helix-turn-helix domain-containing protein [Archangium violaceum]
MGDGPHGGSSAGLHRAPPHRAPPPVIAFTRWTRSRLAEYLRQRTGVDVSPEWVGQLPDSSPSFAPDP